MQTFTGWQYLLIDAANQFGPTPEYPNGLDKQTFEARIKWSEAHLADLETMADQADTKPLFIKATQAIRKAQRGQSTGHLVGLDASCSGIQIMSVCTGCEAGARATGLIDPDTPSDAYALTKTVMNQVLEQAGLHTDVSRKQAKNALMTSFYGSRRVPKTIFGTDTPQLDAFYQAAMTVAPGAWDLLQALLASWQSDALVHAWTLPDGYDARVKVMDKVEDYPVEIDELDHATFTYTFYENKPLPRGHVRSKSNAANVVHSLDAYVLRCIHRRCNYDRGAVIEAFDQLAQEQILRLKGAQPFDLAECEPALARLILRWHDTKMADAVVLPYLQPMSGACAFLPTELIDRLLALATRMLAYRPFPVVTIHDEFKCHPNHLNTLRQTYIDVLAELAESNVLSDILSQIHGKPGFYPKRIPNLGELIRQGNYGLC